MRKFGVVLLAMALVLVFALASCYIGMIGGGTGPTGTGPGNGDGGPTGPVWTAVADSPFDLTVSAIVYGNNRFVAWDNAFPITVATSTDGITWTAGTVDNFRIHEIAYGNGVFVAIGDDVEVGSHARFATSTDALTWTPITDRPFSYLDGTYTTLHYTPNAIAFGGNTFVAMVTIYMAGGTYNHRIATSTDGLIWTEATPPPPSDGGCSTIAYGNGTFVAAGFEGQMMASTDGGRTWTLVEDGAFGSAWINLIAYGNGRFVAVARVFQGTGVATSTDGLTWTVSADALGAVDAIAYGNGRFVVVGQSGKAVISTDGSTWTTVADTAFSYHDIDDVAYGNGTFVAVGWDGRMAYWRP